MIVVSDTTPLNYLILTETAHVLAALFGKVYAPSAVLNELSHSKSPESVRMWAANPPSWLIVRDPANAGYSKLGRGEAAAISLALDLKADRILIDERDTSREARRQGLTVVGTLGILEEAAKRGLINIERTINELRTTNFRASEKLYQAVLEKVREHLCAEVLGRANGEQRTRDEGIPEGT
jgi:predicted nucleic acid-binding protein